MKRRNFPGRVRQRREQARIRLLERLGGAGRSKYAEPLSIPEIARIKREIATLDARIGGAL